MAAPNEPALIAVDWGTTNRRGHLIDEDGTIMETQADGLGLLNVEGGRFEAAFEALIAPWTAAHGTLPALLSGMVGAKTGWREAPYCPLPTGFDDLADRLERAPSDHPVWIVPGVKTCDEAGVPDVMRGEEIQALAAAGKAKSCLVVLPGTHSKWVRIADGRIVAFTTFMTGDLYAAILNHTVLRKAGRGPKRNPDAFAEGVDTGYARHGALTHILFGARSRDLFDEISDGDVPDYLSGLLIGAELAHALATHAERAVKLVGGDALRQKYSDALLRCGVTVETAEPASIGRTYRDLAMRAGIFGQARP